MNRLAESVTALTIAFLALGTAGCGKVASQNTSPPPPAPPSTSNGSVSAFVQDAPAGTTAPSGGPVSDVAAFQISVTGATLSNAGSTPVVLLSGTKQIELRHLNLAPALAIQAATIPSATYTTLNLTFANPQIAVINSQGQVAQLDGTTTPLVRLSQVQVNVPLSAAVSSDGQLGLSVSFDLLRSLSIDSNGNYVVTPVVQTSVVPNPPQDDQLEDAVGTIETVSSSPQQNFTVQLAGANQAISLAMDGSTIFGPEIGETWIPQIGENITFNARFQSDGAYLATFIGSATPNLAATFEGIIATIGQDSSGNATVSLVAQD